MECCTRLQARFSSENLIRVINNVLSQYYKFQIASSFNISEVCIKETTPKLMISEKVPLTEIGVDLWDRALLTCLGDITHNCYPHVCIVKQFIHYTLNCEIIECEKLDHFFSKLILLHPPVTNEILSYYWSIINTNDISLHGDANNRTKENIFWLIIESIISCFKKQCPSKETQDSFNSQIGYGSVQAQEKDLVCGLEKSKIIYFNSLPLNERIHRVLIVLKFFCEILGLDFVNKSKFNNFNDSMSTNYERTFLSLLLWSEEHCIGSLNNKILGIVDAYVLADKINFDEIHVVRKLLSLTAEVLRMSNISKSSLNSFLGNSTEELAMYISVKFLETLEIDPMFEIAEAVTALNPPWLRLLVCSNILTRLTGMKCRPELNSLRSILELLLSSYQSRSMQVEPKIDDCEEATRKLRKFGKDGLCFGSISPFHLKELQKPSLNKRLRVESPDRKRWQRGNLETLKPNESMQTVFKLCVQLAQSYFSTYRTLDVCINLKGNKLNPGILEKSANVGDTQLNLDYMRYQKDIEKSLPVLRMLTRKLKMLKEFQSYVEILCLTLK